MSINDLSEQDIKQLLNQLGQLEHEMAKVIVGQSLVIKQLLVSILAGGHCLLEGVPGLAKTLMVNALADTLKLDFKRVQFTPDLMPSDIIGTEILETDHDSGDRFFKFQQGPVFTNILLADEINRTPPKTQAALLEAMQEKKISYAGTSYALPAPFFVLATQNPVEQAGTYPLPEAQLDRFLTFIKVDYPTEQEEIDILRKTTGTQLSQPDAVLNAQQIIQLQQLVREVELAEPLLLYITSLVRNTRPQHSQINSIKEFVRWGAGPRAGQALVLCAKANALLNQRFTVTLEDIKGVAHGVLRHRMLLSFQAEAQNKTTDDLIAHLLAETAAPTGPLSN